MLAAHNPNQDQLSIVEALQRLTERLAAPDLTAAEAKMLQPRLLSLLDASATAPCSGNDFASDLTVACLTDRCAVA